MRSRPMAPVCLAVLLSGAASAVAAKGGPARQPPREAELAKKEDSKLPERDLAGDITRHKHETAKERPALEYDQYKLGVGVQVASKRQEQIETLQKIIALGPSPQEAPDLLFRLAELY